MVAAKLPHYSFFRFVAISNLNHDVNKTLNNKVASVESKVNDVAPEFKEKVRIAKIRIKLMRNTQLY